MVFWRRLSRCLPILFWTCPTQSNVSTLISPWLNFPTRQQLLQNHTSVPKAIPQIPHHSSPLFPLKHISDMLLKECDSLKIFSVYWSEYNHSSWWGKPLFGPCTIKTNSIKDVISSLLGFSFKRCCLSLQLFSSPLRTPQELPWCCPLACSMQVWKDRAF